MAVYFTSDTHFSHIKIMKYCNRPFKSVSHMNETILNNWRETITKKDVVYHLGDVAFGDDDNVERLVKRITTLPGTKYLVLGNHDIPYRYLYYKAFAEILPPLFTKDFPFPGGKKQRVLLSHYPLLPDDYSFRGAINLHGHMHGRLPCTRMLCDVGVDAWAYKPARLDEILKKMGRKEVQNARN